MKELPTTPARYTWQNGLPYLVLSLILSTILFQSLLKEQIREFVLAQGSSASCGEPDYDGLPQCGVSCRAEGGFCGVEVHCCNGHDDVYEIPCCNGFTCNEGTCAVGGSNTGPTEGGNCPSDYPISCNTCTPDGMSNDTALCCGNDGKFHYQGGLDCCNCPQEHWSFNSATCHACNESSPVCGNEIVETGEECDDGDMNGDIWSVCKTDCTEWDTQCNDGEDNDGDGNVDGSDLGCQECETCADAGEDSPWVPQDDDEYDACSDPNLARPMTSE